MLGGLYLIAAAVLGAPSFWYLPCFWALPIIAGFWVWKPRIGAALSIGPLVSAIVLLHYLAGVWLACPLAFVVLALASILITARESGMARVPLAISVVFLCLSFATDRLFTNRLLIHSYQVKVALDGDAPWGTVGPEWSDDVKPVVLFRPVGDSYCYVAFKSNDLRQRLANRNGSTVSMQVNLFEDFGKERGYSVRSVDGLLLNDGRNIGVDAERFGGQILGSSGEQAISCW
jgi:hypothetical protein